VKEDRDAHLLSGAYALDSVTGEEAAEVEAAMADSEELRGEVAELTDTAVLLGLSVKPEDPPPALRARLLDLIEQVPQLPAGQGGKEVAEPSRVAPAAEAVPAGDHVATRRTRRRPALLLALAAVAVLLFAGGLLVERAIQPPPTQAENAFARLTSAADVRSTQATVASGGTVTVYWSASLDESGVVLNGVQKPAGKSLQMWRVTGSTPVSAGLYAPPPGQHYAVMKGALRPDERLAVTVEPPGGSTKPTTKPIVVLPNA
jgi:anti-sigma-K factor RskA